MANNERFVDEIYVRYKSNYAEGMTVAYCLSHNVRHQTWPLSNSYWGCSIDALEWCNWLLEETIKESIHFQLLPRMQCFDSLKCTNVSGDVEPNPGPFWKKDEDAIENLQDIIDDQADEIKDLKETVEKQSETIEELKSKIEEILVKTEDQKTESEKAAKNLADLVRRNYP